MTQSNQREVAAFTRDVLINVLANLIAAAIIYLAGSAAGLFTSNDKLQALSWVLVIVAGALLMVLITMMHRRAQGRTAAVIAGVVLGSAVVAAGVLYPDLDWWLRPVLIIPGAAFAGVAVNDLRTGRSG